MISGILEGMGSYRHAVGMVTKHRLWRYVILPSVLSLVSISLLVGLPAYNMLTSNTEDVIIDRVIAWVLWAWPFGGEESISNVLEWILELMSGLIVIFVFMLAMFFLAKYVVMIIVSPFMSMLSEKIERIIKGEKSSRHSNFFSDLARGIRIALRNILRELGYTILILPLNLIPGLGNLAAAVLTFMVQSYYAGFGNFDFALERRFGVRGSVQFMRARRGLATGNGIVFLLIFMVPIIGWVLAPVYGTIASTISTLKELDGVVYES